MKSYVNRWKEVNFSLYARLCLWRLKSMFLATTEDMSGRNKMISTVLWFLIMVPSMIGLFWFYRDARVLIAWAIALPLSILPALVVLDSYLRYQLPVQLILTPVAAMFWSRMLDSLKKLLKPRAVFT